jgi:hypothetical protein
MNMAKRKYSKMKKIEASEMTLSFVTETVPGGTVGNFYIDLSQCASIVNRRFYRQGINWAVSGIKILSGVNASIGCRRLPNTWVMSNAWEKGFRAWKRQQDETIEDGTQESVKAKFNDFKIFADSQHLAGGFVRNLLPFTIEPTGAQATYAPGEWEASQIVIPNYGTPGTNYEPFIMAVGDDVGGAGGAFSLIKAYENSRSVPQSPDPVTPGGVLNTENIYRAMFDVGDNNEDVLENVVGKNDELPYDQLAYPGADINAPNLITHDFDTITGTTIGSMTRMKGGNFPCGLMNFLFIPETTSGVTIQVDLVPGNHRGYLCEPMTDM